MKKSVFTTEMIVKIAVLGALAAVLLPEAVPLEM